MDTLIPRVIIIGLAAAVSPVSVMVLISMMLIYKGQRQKGTYSISGKSVILVPSSGEKITLKYEKGEDMMKDRLVGDEVTRMRV